MPGDNQYMAATEVPPLPAGATSYDPGRYYDEAFADAGQPHAHYAPVLEALAGVDLERTHRQVRQRLLRAGCTFGEGSDCDAFKVDLVPRLFTADEWAPLARGLEQRVRALDAFIADVYGERRIVAEGVIPARVIDGAEHHQPELRGIPRPPLSLVLAGLDIVRTPHGEFQVLEDNLRTPSGLAYAFAARRAVEPLVGGAVEPVPIERRTAELLGRALRNAAPRGRVVLLSDGPQNTAFWEHQRLADLLDVPLVGLDDLRADDVDVVYRRTDEDNLRDADGRLTSIGAALIEPLRAGKLTCVNGLGNGVADDKLVHAYVEDMIRFYLGQEPQVRSVPTFDLSRTDCRAEVLDHLDEMVVKPRAAYGGDGVFVGPQSGPRERDAMAAAIRAEPEEWIAQDTVFFSRHPTLIDGTLEPRHVDLRAFVVFDGERAETIPGGLTRVAYPEGELVVNSSQGGGGKDTWVLP